MSSNLIIDIQSFPSTRYRGSKRKLLHWIYDALKDIEFNTVLDGFGGTGSVSYLFKAMGKEVTFNDYLKFNSIIGKSIIENSFYKLDDKDQNAILNATDYSNTLISKYFKDIYFLDDENQWIDNIAGSIRSLVFEAQEGEDFKKCIAFNALFQACLIKRPFNLFHRKNLSLRTNDVERSFGNKVTWEREFEYYFKHFSSEINLSIFNSKSVCRVENKDIFEIENCNFDLVYLDPPYVVNNSRKVSSDYLRSYHFLEGISNYEEWFNNIDFSTRILNLNDSFLPNHFKVSAIEETFEALIFKFKSSKIVVSYKFGGVPSIDFIIKLLEKHKKRVITRSIHYKYALNRQNGNASLNREYLIIGI